MIVVTGSTGTVGSAVVWELAALGHDVRAVVRDTEKAAGMFGPNVALAVGDLSDPATLDDAFTDASRVFLLTPTGPTTIDHTQAAMEAAARAGVQHVVKLSALGTDPESPIQLARWHAEGEALVRDSGIAHSFLHPGSFMQNTLMDVGTIREKGAFFAARGSGRRALIDARDIAAVAAAVLGDPADYAGATLYLTGGRAVSDAECAEILSSAIGQPVDYVPVPPEAAAAAMRAAGLPDWLVADLLLLDDLTAQGHMAEVTPTVATILGRPPLTFAEFARDYATAFTG